MTALYLAAAASLAFAIGLAHSWLGERYILTRLFRRELPKLFGNDWFTKRTLRFAWHLTTVAWWGFGALLLVVRSRHGSALGPSVLWVIVAVFATSGAVALVASRGRHLAWIVFLAIALLAGLAAATGGTAQEEAAAAAIERDAMTADVVSVRAGGSPGAYQFAVGVASPDTGCERYADWWEVISLDGELLYRRILTHSHVREQPFVRRGGPVSIGSDDVVWVRAHMHPTGYGGAAFRGSVAGGFERADMPGDFAVELAKRQPLPEGCEH